MGGVGIEGLGIVMGGGRALGFAVNSEQIFPTRMR